MKNNRGQWSSNLGFILAAAGSAIGLGNLWKFPYLAGANGGGIFVLFYLIFVVVIGFTVMLAEMSVGRHAQLSAYGAYAKIDKRFSFIGVLGILSSYLILSFYSVVGGWVVNYIFKYITVFFNGTASQEFAKGSGDYFGNLISNPWQPLMWHGVFIFMTAFIVFKGVSSGIEKYSKILMPALFVMLISVAIRSVTLPGAMEGVKYLFKPDISNFTIKGLIDSMGQVFYSLSLGMGCMITYGSYLSKDENLAKNALVIPALDTAMALLSGLAIMPAVFATPGVEPGQGPGLIFVTLPKVFAAMPGGAAVGNFFGLIFFILVFFAAVTSSVSLLEVATSFVIDTFGWERSRTVIRLTLVVFLLGVPSSLANGPMGGLKIFGLNFFDLMDFITSNIMLPLAGLLVCIFVFYFWKVKNAEKEISSGGKYKFALKNLWAILVGFVTPIAIVIVFLNTLGILKF